MPKDCIARIKHVHIVFTLLVELRWAPVPLSLSCEADKKHTPDLNDVCRAILKHFIGIECVTIRAGPVNQYGGFALPRLPDGRHAIMTGDIDGLVKAIRKLLDGLVLKELKEVRWMQEEGLKLDGFAEKVKHEKLEETVKMKFVKWDVWRP